MEKHNYIESEMIPAQCAICQQQMYHEYHIFSGAVMFNRPKVKNLTISEPAGTYDPVEAPSHYCVHQTTTAQLVVDWNLNFFLGNVLKYIERHKLKGKPLQDLQKAKKWLEMAIELEETGVLERTVRHG